jgi:hypothetical protein
MIRVGLEEVPFPQAVRFETARIGEALEKMRADKDYFSWRYQTFCYTHRGFYAEHLTRWFAHFDRDRFLIVRSENLYTDPSATLRRILAFVGVDPQWRPAEFANFSYRQGPPAEYDDMDAATRTLLEERFAPHNQRLTELLGPEFSW